MNKNLGFTLIELMIIVAIIGILVGIAIPAYSGYIANANKSSVQTKMLEISSRLERDRLQNRIYSVGIATELNKPENNKYPSSSNHRYTISIKLGRAVTYIMKATPTSKQKKTDCSSRVLEIDSLGRKKPAECW